MPEVRDVNFHEAIGRRDPINLAHHGTEPGEVCADMFQDMLHEDVLEGVVLKRPGRSLDVHEDVGLALRKVVRVDETVPTVESAPKVQLSHSGTSSVFCRRGSISVISFGRRRGGAIDGRDFRQGFGPPSEHPQTRKG